MGFAPSVFWRVGIVGMTTPPWSAHSCCGFVSGRRVVHKTYSPPPPWEFPLTSSLSYPHHAKGAVAENRRPSRSSYNMIPAPLIRGVNPSNKTTKVSISSQGSRHPNRCQQSIPVTPRLGCVSRGRLAGGGLLNHLQSLFNPPLFAATAKPCLQNLARTTGTSHHQLPNHPQLRW